MEVSIYVCPAGEMVVPGTETACSEGKFYREQLHFAHGWEEMSGIQIELYKDGSRVSKNWFNMMTNGSGARTQDTIGK